MNTKKTLPFVFLFLLLFANLLPEPYIFAGRFPSIKSDYAELIQLYNQIFSTLGYTTYIMGFINVFLLFLFVRFLKTYGCKQGLITLFSVGFIGSYLLKLSIARFQSTVYMSYASDNFYRNVMKWFDMIDIGVIIFLFIIFILIIADINYLLEHNILLGTSTVLLFIFTLAYKVAYMVAVYSTKTNMKATTFSTYELIFIALTILFKLALVIETLDFNEGGNNKEPKENNGHKRKTLYDEMI